MEWRAVVEDNRRAGRQRADQPVPHHPAARGEPENAVAGPHVQMPAMLRRVLEQEPRRSVLQALRRARRARGVEDEPRGIERHRGEHGIVGRSIDQVPEMPGLHMQVDIGLMVQFVDQPDLLQARQAGDDLPEQRAAVMLLPAVDVAVGGHEHLGRDLTEAVEDSGRTEVRARRGEDRTQAGGGQHGDHGFRDVGHPGRHGVTRSDAGRHERGPDRAGRPPQLRPGPDPADSILPAEHQGRVLGTGKITAGEQVLRVVQRGCREEASGPQIVAGRRRHDSCTIAAIADDPALTPYEVPEVPRRGDREVVEVGHRDHGEVGDLLHLAHDPAHRGSLYGSRIRPPQWFRHVSLPDGAGHHGVGGRRRWGHGLGRHCRGGRGRDRRRR